MSLALERHNAADAEMAALGPVKSAVAGTVVDTSVPLCVYMDRASCSLRVAGASSRSADDGSGHRHRSPVGPITSAFDVFYETPDA